MNTHDCPGVTRMAEPRKWVPVRARIQYGIESLRRPVCSNVLRRMALHPQLEELIDRLLPVVQDFHRKRMFSPHAATVDAAGSVSGHALTNDGSTHVSVLQAIEHFERKFSRQADLNEIHGTGIFYHSPGIDTSTGVVIVPPAATTDECRTLVALLEHASGDSFYLLLPYSGEPPAVEYAMGKLVKKPSRVFAARPAPKSKPWWKLW